jgi:hypothetical protein
MPARVLVYHAGIGRVVVIAMIKLTTIFHAVVELCSIYPALAAGESILSAAGLAATGLIPLAFVSTTTAPIATAIHLHLPAYARANARLFERFVASVPPSEATVDMTTLSFIGKPRVSRMKLSELRHVPPDKPWRHTVLGLVNWERDTEAEDRRRKWYHYRAIGKFGVHWANKGVRYAWVWKVLKDKVGVKEAERKSEVKKVDKGHYD